MTHLIEAIDVVKEFKGPRKDPLGLRHLTVHAVDGVSFTLDRGETLGVVGESGCGKSTLGRVVMRLLPATRGQVLLEGEDTALLEKKDKKALRRRMQMVFQDPYASLNPRMTVEEILSEPLQVHSLVNSSDERLKRIYRLLDLCGLRREAMSRYNLHAAELNRVVNTALAGQEVGKPFAIAHQQALIADLFVVDAADHLDAA